MKTKYLIFLAIISLSCFSHSQERSVRLSNYISSVVLSDYDISKTKDYANLLSVLGSLAGYAIQEGLRRDLIETNKLPERKVFTVIKSKSGDSYYFGDYPNLLLFESKDSLNIWYVLTSDFEGDKSNLPDIDEMARRNAERIGSDDFASHHVDGRYLPTESPISSLKDRWPALYARLKLEGLHPLSWGWEIASFAKSEVIDKASVIPESVAIQIFMESAISMSKYDLRK